MTLEAGMVDIFLVKDNEEPEVLSSTRKLVPRTPEQFTEPLDINTSKHTRR